MLGGYAGIRRCHRALFAHTLSRALSQRTATSHITEKKPGSIRAAWPRRNASSVAISSQRDPLGKELQYLGDPLNLAKHVLQLLNQPGQDEKAAEMVRMASKSMPCTVSWNHMIDYYMSEGRVALAMSMYNDVSIDRSNSAKLHN